MSNTTIFNLEDLGIDISSVSSIKVKAKKDNSTSSFASLLIRPEPTTITINSDTLTITSVPNATKYEIYNYSTKIGETTNTTYDLSLLGVSNAMIGVKVVKANYSLPSLISNQIIYNVTSYVSATVSNLGSENPNNVTFTYNNTFTPQTLGIEEITMNGDTFIKIPAMYRKINNVTDNQITSFTIATTKVDNNYEVYPVFINERDEILPYVLIGKYWNTNSSSMVSTTTGSGAPMTIGNARSYARGRGTGYQQWDWMFQKLWQDLIICLKQTIDTNSGVKWTSDELGIYWGENTIYIDGIAKDSQKAWCICYKPSKYIDEATESNIDYTNLSYTAPSNNTCISKLGYDSDNKFANLPSEAVSNSGYNTYYCDSIGTGTAGSLSAVVFSSVGNDSAGSGCFSYNFFTWNLNLGCARLCYRPING